MPDILFYFWEREHQRAGEVCNLDNIFGRFVIFVLDVLCLLCGTFVFLVVAVKMVLVLRDGNDIL